MSKIRVKNFGPIKEGYQENDGWMDIKKVTTFIGNQGSGKSTIAKLISTFMWIEKALVRGDYDAKWFERKNKLKNQYLNYHRLENYFKISAEENTVIEYVGGRFQLIFKDDSLLITKLVFSDYELPQIMYVPAERNFISYVKTPKELKLSSESLKEFLTEFEHSKNALRGIVKLPINDAFVEYDKLNDTLNLRGRDYKVKMFEASSGFQSLVPLYLVSDYLAKSVKKQGEVGQEGMSNQEMERFKKEVARIFDNDSLTEEQKRAAISVLSSRFNKTAFVNIVEEPEQNLFPSSQWQMLQSLLECNNMSPGNKLILTTHSPYIINYLSIAIHSYELESRIVKAGKSDQLLPKLEEVLPLKSLVSAENCVVYQFNEQTGSIQKLTSSEGIPSDHNFLNDMLRQGNVLFDRLLELEEEI